MSEHDYGLADRLMHRLALGSPALAELSFDLDQRMSGAAGKAAAIALRPHVFVAGLARAGSTILLRALHASGSFRSLTYRDMPFPLAPNLWSRLAGGRRRAGAARERAHGDGIHVDTDSPEALEQIFWRVMTGPDYIRRDGLAPHRPDAAAMLRFQRYVAAILASGRPGQWRYLSKNNNNILRLPALLGSFPNALFLIPFRDPAAHARSLWRQHGHFCALQRRAPFVRTYMDWLVHHEFGLGHRPYLIGGAPDPALTPDMPDYWLDTWCRVHAGLAALEDARCRFVCHEDLCADPRVWRDLCRRHALDAPAAPGFCAAPPSPGQQDGFDPARLTGAQALYAALRARSCAPPPA